MRIKKRIPLEMYAYEEIEFDSLEEYEEMYPKYVEMFKRVRDDIRNNHIQLTPEEEKNIKY